MKSSKEYFLPQCLLFYREEDGKMTGTLAGKKKDVYVTMKILKKCTKAEITSFKVQTLHFS